jgi:soluble lytic murein transglycosylase-like protein
MILSITLAALILLLVFAKKGSAEVFMSTNKTVTLYDIIINNSKRFNIPTALIKAVIKQESNWDPYAKNPSDPSYGIMQIMPIAAQDAGIIANYKNVSQTDINEIMDVANNIYAGTYILAKLMKKYTIDIAVEMYNVGERGYNEKGARNSVYRKNVMQYYQHYLDEEAGV